MTQPEIKIQPDLTTEDIARILNVSVRVVRIWTDAGKIPPEYWYKLPGGREYRFKPGTLDYLRNNEKKGDLE